MKASPICMFFFSCIMLHCSPKNEEVTDEQIEIGDATEVLDTVTSAKKDGVRTDENTITPTLPLPPAVLRLLTEQYLGWKEPEYTRSVTEAASGNEQGPGIVRGDFNRDNRQDYALQFQLQEDLYIVAVLDAGANWQLHELQQAALVNEQGKQMSPYLMQVTEEGTTLKDENTGKTISAPYQAVQVLVEGKGTTYLFEKDKFIPYTVAE